MPTFTGQLRPNEIFASLFNMIISQQVFADNFSHNYNLVDKARVDGGLYGDTKIFYGVDALKTHKWGADAEASNLLALDRPKDPSQQAIVIDQFRQIRLTIDNYLSKRAWMKEGSFADFTAVMLQQMTETKRVYENTLYNVFIGNSESAIGGQTRTITITLPQGVARGTEQANRLVGTGIAKAIADLMDELKDYSRDFNDYRYLRSYSEDALKFVWNSSYVNEILLVDLPTVFHNEELKKHVFDEKLTPRYFGTGLRTSNVASVAGERAGEEIEIANVDYFAGDLLPTGVGAGVERKVYTNDASILCKIMVKLPPFMSAFVVGTSFFNPRSLTETRFLTFSHNTLEYLKNYPMITLKLVVNEAE